MSASDCMENVRSYEDDEQIFCEDAVVIRVKDHFGHVWSPHYGRIYFTQNNLAVSPDILDTCIQPLTSVSPGVAARAWAGRNLLGFQHDDSSSFPDIKWKATRVELKNTRSELVAEGKGTVTRAHGGFGFLDAPSFALTLFVPGFAATNNLSPGVSGYQMPQLEAKEVHFLAIPNPKKFKNFFVIALHPLNDSCGTCQETENSHWLSPCSSSKSPPHQLTDLNSSLAKMPSIRLNDLFSPDSLFQKPLYDTEDRAITASSGDGTIQCKDAAFALVKSYCGYLWSPSVGKIYFESPSVQGGTATLTPGLAATCSVIVTVTRGLLAVKVLAEPHRSPHILEGSGMFRAGVACGVVFESASSDKSTKESAIFVPSWALVNAQENCGLSSAEMDGRKVHFMAIGQNLNSTNAASRRVCVIGLHPDVPTCSSPDTSFQKHWMCSRPETMEDQQVLDEEMSSMPDIIPDMDTMDSAASVELTDAYFTYVRSTHGYLRSAEHGMIAFSERQLRGASSMRQLIPGTCARLRAVPLPRSSLARHNVHAPSWQALSVRVERPLQWSADIVEGYGTLVRVRRTYGMLRCRDSGQLMFVPGWAGVNNLAAAAPGWQVPQLANCQLHFLAMPNPKRRYHGEPFVLVVHPVGEQCGTGKHAQHWLQPQPLAALHPTSTDMAPSLNRELIRDVLVECIIKLVPAKLQQLFDRCPQLLDWAYFENTDQRPDDRLLSQEWHTLKKISANT